MRCVCKISSVNGNVCLRCVACCKAQTKEQTKDKVVQAPVSERASGWRRVFKEYLGPDAPREAIQLCTK